MPELPYSLERTVVIRATPEIVFRYFTDSARWAAWWGAGSTIDATPGGKVYIRHPNGAEVSGEVLAVDPGARIVFTYTPPGASRVTVTLRPDAGGTRLHLLHEFDDKPGRDAHIQGWRFQLSLFANVVANEAFAGAKDVVDAWYHAWTVADPAELEQIMARIATPSIRFRDRYSLLDGPADVMAHIAAALRYMPGFRLTRNGEVRHCQGTVLADWTAAQLSGTSVFEFSPDGRIESVTSVSNA